MGVLPDAFRLALFTVSVLTSLDQDATKSPDQRANREEKATPGKATHTTDSPPQISGRVNPYALYASCAARVAVL